MSNLKRTFLVTITILEGRHYIWDNMNSAVVIKVGSMKRVTNVKKNSDSPYYNEYFVFELACTYDALLEKTIHLSVIQPRTFCRSRKVLGNVKLDIATVTNQKDSQFFHKWAILSSPNADWASGPTGYLKVDISVLARGQIPKLPANIANDEIEGNLLMPMSFTSERQRARFIFDIYFCDHLQPKSSHFTDLTKSGKNNTNFDTKISSSVEITFAGSTIKTAVRRNTNNPIFNERLIISELFPPLCQRVKIEICFDGIRKSTLSIHYLNLKYIANDTVEGFLPTFGPTYLHMYHSEAFKDYAGMILMSMRTEIMENTISPGSGVTRSIPQSLSPLREEELFPFEETFLFTTIFEASCISKKHSDKQISFRLTFGHTTLEIDDTGNALNITPAQKPTKSGKHCYYLNYMDEKPCLRIKSLRPDFRKRLYNSNMLEKISLNLESELSEIKNMFEKYLPNCRQKIEERLKESIEHLLSKANEYIDVLKASYEFDYGADLDKERIKVCLITMNGIIDKLPTLLNSTSKKFIYRCLEDFQKRIRTLVEDAQPCWPDIFLWITSGTKKLACLQIPAREIVFSQLKEEKGTYCGIIRPWLFLNKSTVVCKVELLIWLGLENQKPECFSILPEGFNYEGNTLKAKEKYLFEGKAYIFKGEVQPGFDENGLVDPFVQICWGNEIKETQVKKNSLVPLWDETIVFHNLVYYGSKNHIRNNPPHILLQMYDQDTLSIEFVGRNIVVPEIYLLDDTDARRKEDTSELVADHHPKLQYFPLLNEEEIFGQVLATFHLTEISQFTQVSGKSVGSSIPASLKPRVESYRIDVLFWGVRQLRKVNLMKINRPKVSFLCGNKSIESSVIENARIFPNFKNYTQSLNVSLPSQDEYPESFRLELYDSRKFGVYVFAGITIIETTQFLFIPMTKKKRLDMLTNISAQSDGSMLNSFKNDQTKIGMHGNGISSNIKLGSDLFIDNWERALLKTDSKTSESMKTQCWKSFIKLLRCVHIRSFAKSKIQSSQSDNSLEYTEEGNEGDFDWWTKFYASIDETLADVQKNQLPPSARNKIKIYLNELENQPEFGGFSDILTSFEILKGKRTGDEVIDEQHTTAIFKGSVKIYRWPPEADREDYVTADGSLLRDGYFSNYPSNSAIQYILRIYCIRGINLRPKDPNGKSDPYLVIQLGQKLVSDRENYIPKNINPIFGRCFEFQMSFPDVTLVTIRVYDYDFTSADDLIGETKIDIENRFYTKHRAMCGIAETYFTSGYCKWRDQKKPSEILLNVCKKWGLDSPEYRKNSVFIHSKEFTPPSFKSSDDPDYDHQVLALEVLRRWQEMPVVGYKLVPEHVETRSLFISDKPGIEQGKLQLWIDIFPKLDYPVPEQIDISPRKPVEYELRVIVWNTEDIILSDDDFFTGEKKSDIYVKGWLDDPARAQYTDVHYRSLTGEGNFNWRFIFKFEYISSENKLVKREKDSIFSKDDTESKIPCVLTLTVWDNDTFSKDDFLGSLTMELSRMPRGSRSSKKCNLFITKPTAKRINLFKMRRTKGWWPFQAKDKDTQGEMLTVRVFRGSTCFAFTANYGPILGFLRPAPLHFDLFPFDQWRKTQIISSSYEYATIIQGKLEAELQLLTREEAELNPVGMGRQGPEALPPPKYGGRFFYRHSEFISRSFDERQSTYKSLRSKIFHGDDAKYPARKSKCMNCKNDTSKKCIFFCLLFMLIVTASLLTYIFYLRNNIHRPKASCFEHN